MQVKYGIPAALVLFAMIAAFCGRKRASSADDAGMDAQPSADDAGKSAREIAEAEAARIRSQMASKASKARWAKKKEVAADDSGVLA